jgi:hypothetical protein
MGGWPLRAVPSCRRRGDAGQGRQAARYERQPVPCDLRSPLGVQAARVPEVLLLGRVGGPGAWTCHACGCAADEA